MKKWICMIVGALLALSLSLPAAAEETGLPGFAAAIAEGAKQGFALGAQTATAGMDGEFSIALSTDMPRIEEEQTVRLCVALSNPRAQETPVQVTLTLPEALVSSEEMTLEVLLPAAQTDEETGALMPSETVISRMLTLKPGSRSEEAQITAELSVGTRFYRASAPLAICVPDIAVHAAAEGMDENGRVQPGDPFSYTVTIENAGAAGKQLPITLSLPRGAKCMQLPEGFAEKNGVVSGSMAVGEAQDGENWQETLTFGMQANEDALGAEQTRLMLTGTLTADARPVALPRLEVCCANVNASLSSDKDSLAVGEEMELSLIVTNTGLVPADVLLTCRLPQGLTLLSSRDADEEDDEEAPVTVEDDGGNAAGAQAASTDLGETLEQAERIVRVKLRMDAAGETEDGLAAATRRVTLRVRADVPMEDVKERLLGASMTYAADDGEAQLGDALAVRVVRDTIFGLNKEQASNIFWATVLLGVTLSCLFAVFKNDDEECAE